MSEEPLSEEQNAMLTREETALNSYTEDDIRSLDWLTHLRERPGMYIGKLGDGSSFDDGIYVLLKEVADNAIDEFIMGNGKRIIITVSESEVSVRDFGRGIPLGALVDVTSKINTGGKFKGSNAFHKSVGLNGVGIKAANALSESFTVTAVRDGKSRTVRYTRGKLVEDTDIVDSTEANGTFVSFKPDPDIFPGYAFRDEFVRPMVKNYSYLHTGLTLTLNGERFVSRNGLLDLLQDNLTYDPLYPIIHLKGDDI